MRHLNLFVLLLLAGISLPAQDSFLRADFNMGPARFLGIDLKEMKDNRSWAFGAMMERESSGFIGEYGRYQYGVRIRHLQAEIDHYTNDSLGQLVRGYERYQYNYLEFPFTAEVEPFSGSRHLLPIGGSFGFFGAIPFGVKGERNYSGANPWSKKYETPYFIFGFQVGGYIGLNLARFGFKAHYIGQFPFIPIPRAAPSSYTGPPYKVQLLGMRGWMFSLNYNLNDSE
jgi:hypothetical protein